MSRRTQSLQLNDLVVQTHDWSRFTPTSNIDDCAVVLSGPGFQTKNTFITVEEDELDNTASRSSSLPPSLRLSSYRSALKAHGRVKCLLAKKLEQRRLRAKGASDSEETDSQKAAEEGSTDDGSELDRMSKEESNSSASSSCMSDRGGAYTPPLSPQLVAEQSQPYAYAMPFFALPAVDDQGAPAMEFSNILQALAPNCSFSVAANTAPSAVAPAVPTTSASSGSARSQVALNPRARAWAPNSGIASLPRAKLDALLAKVKTALLTCAFVLGAEVCEGQGNSYTVKAWISAADFEQKDVALAQAEEVLGNPLNLAKNVCLVGHKARPFVATPMGFSASFCDASGKRNCWSMLSTGVCNHRENCQWTHPSCVTVNVMVLLDSSN